MNIIDKIITSTIAGGHKDVYADKDNWNSFDYFMGYGLPIIMVGLVFRIIYLLIVG